VQVLSAVIKTDIVCSAVLWRPAWERRVRLGMFEWMEETTGELLISARQWSGVYLAALVMQQVRRHDLLHNRYLLQQGRCRGITSHCGAISAISNRRSGVACGVVWSSSLSLCLCLCLSVCLTMFMHDERRRMLYLCFLPGHVSGWPKESVDMGLLTTTHPHHASMPFPLFPFLQPCT